MTQNATDTIAQIIRKNANIPNLGEDDDFFEAGVSSLTVVSMQLEIETALGREVATKELMKKPSISGWSSAYSL
jgi:acyl carrier protein